MKTLITTLALTVLVTGAHAAATSLSYVQDGLVAQWDGIENVGRGQHDATARFWADISGNGHTFTNFISALTWTDDNGLQMPSSGYDKAATTPAFGLANCVSYEVVFKQTKSPNYGMVFAFGNFRGCFISQDRKSIHLHGGANSTWASETALEMNAIHHVYGAYQDGETSLGESVVVDGLPLTLSTTQPAAQNNTGYNLGYWHGTGKGNRAFYGEVYAIRIYSRRLSAAEREWNRLVDNKRFIDPEMPWNPPTEVTPSVSVVGSGTVTPAVPTAVGEDIDLTATPSEGYAFGCWSGNVPEDVDVTDPHLVFKVTGSALNITAHFQKVVYVAEDGSDGNGGTSWDDAFATIATALASCDNPYVQVGPGTFASAAAITVDKAATIAGSENGTVQTVVKLTAKAGAAFILTHKHARLTNLAITTAGANGRGVCLAQGGLVDHCMITNCYAYQDNYKVLPVPSENTYDPGAGVLVYLRGRVCDSTVSNCHSWCNTTRSYSGGGVQIVGGGIVDRCRIVDCYLDRGSGGGVAIRNGGVLRNSLVSGCYLKSGDSGCGIRLDGGSVENCTIAGNYHTSSATAKGFYATDGIVRNTIIWGNRNQVEMAQNSIAAGVFASYCTSETLIPGEGNQTTDPKFKDADNGDYTLTLSDCVNAGVAMPWHDMAVDLKGDPRVIDDIVDLGCYEFKTSGLAVGVSVEGDGNPDLSAVTFRTLLQGKVGATVSYAWTITGSNGFREEVSGAGDDYASVTRNLTAGVYEAAVTVTSGELTADGAASYEIEATHTYVAVGGTGLPPYAASNPGGDIQTVLASTADNGTVHLAPGFYTMSDKLSLIRPIRILSDGGRGAASIYIFPKSADTSIVEMNHAEAALDGVLVSGYSEDRKTRPTQDSGMTHGIAIGTKGGTVTNCIVDGVSGNYGGAGIDLSAGLVTDSIVRGCYIYGGGANKYGGGVRVVGGTVSRCVISNNTAKGYSSGGGVYLTGGRLENSLVVDNEAGETGGGIQNVGGTVVNCLVCDNVAAQAGTGVCQSKGSLLNLTIADNRTNTADVVGCNVTGGTMKNCIVWGNEGTVQLSASDEIAGDSSNWWAADPLFKSVARGDYRLKSSSKCIDKGDDTAWEDLSGVVDLKGGPRLLNKHVDIGCYECALRGLVLILY